MMENTSEHQMDEDNVDDSPGLPNDHRKGV